MDTPSSFTTVKTKATGGLCCTAYGCSRRFRKEDNVWFHSYPLKDTERLKKWLAAMRRENFTPTKSSQICCDHFLASDYHPGLRELRITAVSSVFNFPEHLQKPVQTPRRPLKRNFTFKASSESDEKPVPEKKIKQWTLKLPRNDSTATLLESKFSCLSLEMLKNQLKNGERKTQGKRYDDEIKNFALTLYLYSFL